MKRFLFAALTLLLLGAGCSAPTSFTPPPEEFYGVAIWNLSPTGALQTAASTYGSAYLDMSFTLTDYPDAISYFIQGDIRYMDGWGCHSTDAVGTCSVSATQDGILIGTGTVDGDSLNVKLRYPDSAPQNIRPTEHILAQFTIGGTGEQEIHYLETSMTEGGLFSIPGFNVDLSSGGFYNQVDDPTTAYGTTFEATGITGSSSGTFWLFAEQPDAATVANAYFD